MSSRSNTLTAPSRKSASSARNSTDIRAQGYARSAGERVLGITAIAAPILDGSGAVQGALGLTGPSDELSGEQAQRIVPELRRAATAIGTRYPVAA